MPSGEQASSARALRAPVRFRPAKLAGSRVLRPLCGLLLILGLLMLAPPRAGDQGLAVPVRYAQVKLAVHAPALLRLELPAGQYYVSPASLGYFSQNNEFVFTADVRRGLIYGLVERDPAAPSGMSRPAVYALEISSPGENDLFLAEYLQTIRQRVDNENLAANRLRDARNRDAEEPQKSRRLAAQPLAFNWQELGEGALNTWVEYVMHDYADLVDDMPSAIQQEAQEHMELKQLHYKSEAAAMDQMLASFELQMTLAKLPKPKIDSLLALGDSGSVQDGGLDQLGRMREAWLQRQRELQQELAVSQQWLERTGGLQAESRQPAPIFKPAAGQLPALDTGLVEIDPRRLLERCAVNARISLAEAELGQLKETLRLADGLRLYINKGGSGRNTDGFKMLAIPRSSFNLLSVDHLDSFSLMESAAQDEDKQLPVLLKLARDFEGLDSGSLSGLPAAVAGDELSREEMEIAYGLLLLDRATRRAILSGSAAKAPTSAEKADGAAASIHLAARLAGVLADPPSCDMADSNLGYVAFLNWYGNLLVSLPAGIQATAAAQAISQDTAKVQPTSRPGRQPSASGRQPGQKAPQKSTSGWQ